MSVSPESKIKSRLGSSSGHPPGSRTLPSPQRTGVTTTTENGQNGGSSSLGVSQRSQRAISLHQPSRSRPTPAPPASTNAIRTLGGSSVAGGRSRRSLPFPSAPSSAVQPPLPNPVGILSSAPTAVNNHTTTSSTIMPSSYPIETGSPSLRINPKRHSLVVAGRPQIASKPANGQSPRSSLQASVSSSSNTPYRSGLGLRQSGTAVTTPSPLIQSRSVIGNHPHASFTRRSQESTPPAPSISPYEMGAEDELVTEVPDYPELDEEMQTAIDSVVEAHSNKLADLRRLLSSADHGSSMTMHLLHAEIKMMREKTDSDRIEIEKLKKSNSVLSSQLERARSIATVGAGPRGSMAEILSNTSDQELTRYFRTLPSPARLHLLHLLLEAALPGDIGALIKYLVQIERTKRDFISNLPDNLAIRCLLHLDVRSILRCRMVSKKWDQVITCSSLKLWRALSISLTSQDDEPPRPKEDTARGWFELYQGLHYREENWKRGLAQRVVVLKGHTGSIGALKLRGTTLVTGSLDGTLRIWNVRSANCLKIVKMPAPVSSLDFHGQYGPGGVIAAGGNDVGRVFLISMNGTLLSTLSGHNKGIRTVVMNSDYLVSGGYDKALVVWNWKEGTRIVKFGQQTNPCAAISIFGSSFSSVQVDGVIRCFDIINRELVSQHKVQGNIGGNNGELFQWFVAEARRVIIATKTTIFQLEYHLAHDGHTVDLSSPPRLVSITPIVHELNSGTLDVLKRRFAAAPRFATRLGDDMRIFIGHLPESEEEARDDGRDGLQPIEGAWLDADSRVSLRNPTVMSLSSDQLVVGCSDGLLYALDFCGTAYRKRRSTAQEEIEE